ncbi:hypothetical protein [Actinotalea subterranea]|uniref:hypothetical protein n=1 Tax=Actinotalea subterranea TaxID=2607497 RepID=UPI0011EE5197|nr:hypothetical protein [Actinotalea subterranea]
MRLSRTFVAPLAVGGLLLLTACGGSDAAGDKDRGADASTARGSQDTQAAESGGASCLEGEWTTDIEALREATLAAPGIADLDPEVSVTGESRVTFDGSAMTTEYTSQVSQVTLTMKGQEYVTQATYDGTVVGQYTATDADLVVTDVDVAGLTVTSRSIVDGEEIETPDVQDLEGSGLDQGGTFTYTCTDTELRLTPVVEGTDTSSFVQILRR